VSRVRGLLVRGLLRNAQEKPLPSRCSEARALLATVRQQQPQLSIEWLRANVPYQTQEIMELFLDGMRKAGLGETHSGN